MTVCCANRHLPDGLAAVVSGGACCGCGVCAGLAPCGELQMQLSDDGSFTPHAGNCTDCGVCVQICPGAAETVISPNNSLGEYVETLVGHSIHDGERLNGSSGGLAMRLLKALLDRGEVEAVVAPIPTPDSDLLFQAAVLRSSDAVDRAAGSKYYPVHFADALTELHSTGETFALIGLPCVITSVRLGMRQCPWVRDQCRALIGLTCGHLVTTHYTTFLAASTGVVLEDLQGVNYRMGIGPRGAGDYKFVATRKDGSQGRELAFLSGGLPATVWGARLFTLAACFRCTDLFAIDADVTLMDAWLPEYRDDRAGTSLVVVRSDSMRDLIEGERLAGRVHVEPIEPERVIASQAGALAHRRRAAAFRVAEARGRRPPLRRRLSFGWERLRSRLSNRLFAGGPIRRAVGVRVVRGWIVAHRAGQHLREFVALLLEPLRTPFSRRGKS